LRFSAYGLFYFITVQLLHDINRLKKTVAVISVLGAIIAIIAIIQKLTSPNAIYWFRPAPSATPVGPWVYSNHFAGFMEMLFPLVIALFLFYRPHIHYKTGLRSHIVALLTMPGANRDLLLGTGAMLMAVSILMSLSRGGIITLCLAFLFFILLSSKLVQDRRIKWAAVLTIVTILMISWLGWEPIIQKFSTLWGEQGLNTKGRLPVFLDSLKIVQAFPLTGSGFGTFTHIYPAFRSVPGDAVFDHAHNDYIELLTDGGIIGFTLAAWFVLNVIIHSIRVLKQRKEPYCILITSGAITGLLGLLFHSLVDFQMHNGANALYFFFFCGLAVSGAHSRIQFRSHPTLLHPCDQPALTYAAAGLALIILTCSPWYNSAVFRARRAFIPVRSVYLNPYLSQDRLQQLQRQIKKTAAIDPFESLYRFSSGSIALVLKKTGQARHHYLAACLLNPMSAISTQQLGLALDRSLSETTARLLSLGCKKDPNNFNLYQNYCFRLFKTGQRSTAIDTLHAALDRRPEWVAKLDTILLIFKLSREEIEKMLPSRPRAWYEMGELMESYGRLNEAEYDYIKVLEFLDAGKIEPRYFSRLYGLYMRQKRLSEALDVLRAGIKRLPEYPPFREHLGDYYLRRGIFYRALEEYGQALNLQPDNMRIRKKLKTVQDRQNSSS